MPDKWDALVVAGRAAGAASAFGGVALLLVQGHGGGSEFVYFTTQSNLLVGLCFLWGAAAGRRSAPPPFLRGAVTLYMLVTFLVFHGVLANPASGFGNGAQHFGPLHNILLHTLTPILTGTDWVLIRVGRARWWWSLAWQAYPLGYLAFALVRGTLVGSYPYPFLDVHSLGYGGVSGVSAALLVVFVLLGLVVVAAGRIGRRAAPPLAAPAGGRR
jgi:hypothetical protein